MEEKNFGFYCFHAKEEELKRLIKDFFKINSKKIGQYVKFKNYGKKSPFIIYANFGSILVSEDNGK